MKSLLIYLCCFAVCYLPILAQEPETRKFPVTWYGKHPDGWEASLSLSREYNGRRRGSFFWVFDKQDILWNMQNGFITIQFKDAWHQFSKDSFILKMKETDIGLQFIAEGISSYEEKELAKMAFKPEGTSAYSLGNFQNSTSPYSKFHDAGKITLDMNKLPQGLAVMALKVFQCGGSEIAALCRNRKLPQETLRRLLDTSERTKDLGSRKNVKPWQGGGGVILALSDHPNLQKEDLTMIWNRDFVYSEPIIWRKVINHPNADPAWKEEYRRRLTKKTQEGERMRSVLSKAKDLDNETLDLLLDFYKTDTHYRAHHLAVNPNMDAARLRKIYQINPYDTAVFLALRDDTPPDILKQIIQSEDERAIRDILHRAKAPHHILEQAALKLSKSRDLHRASDACASRYLNITRAKTLASHPEPMIRAALATNPELPMSILKALAQDDYSSVSNRARLSYQKRMQVKSDDFLSGLRAINQLKPYQSVLHEVHEAIRKDDEEWFIKVLKDFWLPLGTELFDGRYKGFVEAAVKNKAYKVLGAWKKQNPNILNHLVRSNAMQWDEATASFILDNDPDEKVVIAYITGIIKSNREDLVDTYLRRNLSLDVVNKEPLVWYAVAHRNDSLAKKLIQNGLSPEVPYDGRTPAMLAVELNYTAALEFLHFTDKQKKALEAFKTEFSGDPDAAWLGSWTNGKSEFNTLVFQFLADGNGAIITATGIGAPLVWKKINEQTVEIYPVLEGRISRAEKITATIKADILEIQLSENRVEQMKRAKEKKK